MLDERLVLAPQVSVRPESFGALLYHYGNRRMSFLKDRRLSQIVLGLDGSASGRDACRRAGVEDDDLATYERALQQLAESDLVQVAGR